jgi:aminoglycoside 6-adenylyltransferase
MDCMDAWVRPQLRDMVSWYAGILTGFSCSMGKSGKYLERYLPADIWEKYLQTYTCADIAAMWKSIFLMADLFEDVAMKVGKEFGFIYNAEEAHGSLSFIRRVHQLPKDAESIF